MSASIAYIPHGAGPMPLLGEPGHKPMVDFLQNLGQDLPRPDAVIVISAHHEGPDIVATSAAHPTMLYDYYGFPAPAYEFQYPAPGAPKLAEEIISVLSAAGVHASADPERGYDHGMFVPMMLLYPKADIATVQLSLRSDLEPEIHIAVGRALGEKFADRNILILGSGMSFHNMKALRNPSAESRAKGLEFHNWLLETLTGPALSGEEREKRLAGWAQAPSARFAHPREEHLLPLHVCAGFAGAAGRKAEIVFDAELLGHHALGAVWR